MFRSVLVANRGEIALRVIRTLQRLGVRAIAVYSDADAEAPHVDAADAAIRLGPARAAESYNSVERVVDAARRSGAEALHPGYGFLSENPALAEACARAGIAFVGPPPAAMALLGHKVQAKRAAEEAGVPVVPGLQRDGLTDAEIVAFAAEPGRLPLMIKAAAGGGGRGMRVVGARDELPGALVAARREALAGFNDDALLVERYVPRARHIEVQVLADAHGHAVHLGERECSLQRRHQKIVEEAPSPVVPAELRARMGEAAVALALQCGYVGAGTVELLVPADDPERFYFLEMNARLQVEHPVTEAVTGLDLVEWQLRIAAGEPLPFRSEDVPLTGHAIEARVYAEDPARDFLPGAGRVVAYREPARAGVRVDSGIRVGSEVGTAYDAMLGKVIAHGADRAQALDRLERALAEFVVLGPPTNLAYLRALLGHPLVRAGRLDTALVERLGPLEPPADPLAVVAATLALSLERGADDALGDDPFDALTGWRLSGVAPLRRRLAPLDGGRELEVGVRPAGRGWEVTVDDGDPVLVTAQALDGGAGIALCADGIRRRYAIAREGDRVRVGRDGRAWGWRQAVAVRERARGGAASLEAPMPGAVIAVHVAEGEDVEEGQVLVVLESMKMELPITAPAPGTVTALPVRVGDQVALGQPLVDFAPREPAEALA